MPDEAHEPGPDAPSPEQVEHAVEVLEALLFERIRVFDVEEPLRKRLMMAAGRLAGPSREERKEVARARRKRKRDKRIAEDTALLDQTAIRQMRENPIFLTPRRQRRDATSEAIGTLHDARTCYTCQSKFTEVHPFYDHLCMACGDLNFAKRDPTFDLTGRIALVTGARVKIGYQAAIMLLRNGCRVEVVTRFPRDAARRYAAEDDFDVWGHRLRVHGVDLRHTPSVERFCEQLVAELPHLDLIINNACQTVRRPSGFYDHMLGLELGDPAQLSVAEAGVVQGAFGTGVEGESALVHGDEAPTSAALSQVELLPEDGMRGGQLFPAGQLDADLQQVDLRAVNSWRLKMAEVSTVELLEVQLVNAVAPYVINARLKPLMARVSTNDAHIVNVSAMEGQFYRTFKSEKHPHTNMAKAALNMMTRTAALDYIDDGIHMNSVDTGWVTDEDPEEHAQRKREEHRFHPPLDIVDGAARIVDPFFDGLATGDHVWGQFLKDYKPCDW